MADVTDFIPSVEEMIAFRQGVVNSGGFRNHDGRWVRVTENFYDFYPDLVVTATGPKAKWHIELTKTPVRLY